MVYFELFDRFRHAQSEIEILYEKLKYAMAKIQQSEVGLQIFNVLLLGCCDRRILTFAFRTIFPRFIPS